MGDAAAATSAVYGHPVLPRLVTGGRLAAVGQPPPVAMTADAIGTPTPPRHRDSRSSAPTLRGLPAQRANIPAFTEGLGCGRSMTALCTRVLGTQVARASG